MVGVRDFARLTSLLARTSRVPDEPRPHRRVKEEHELTTASGVVYDWFEPKGESEATVIPLHGATLNGKDDARLQHFARSLCVSGATCAVPTLPALSDMRWEPNDIDALAEVIDRAAERSGQPVGLIGFSFAGAYCLLAAARPAVADQVRFVIGVGAYHRFPDVYEHFMASRERDPAEDDQAAWDDRIYLHLTIAHRQADHLDLPVELRASVDDLLHRFCNRSYADEKRAFFERHLRALDLVPIDTARQDEANLEALSPAGKLEGLRCRVGLVHDPADGIVPAVHAEGLAAELAGLPGGDRHRVLVSPLMRHVNLAGALNLKQVLKLYEVLAPLVRP